jgi:hypothetical protein
MKEHAVIFSAAMVHSLLAGSKTQTRRLDKKGLAQASCLYGARGDRIWVKEAFKRSGDRIIWRADHPGLEGPWTSPLFLPRKDTRILLELTSTDRQRLHDVSDADARAEGMACNRQGSARDWFMGQWQAVHGAGAWDLNPLVWVLRFRPIDLRSPLAIIESGQVNAPHPNPSS